MPNDTIQYVAGFAFGEECIHNRDRTGKLEGRVVLVKKRIKVNNGEQISSASAGLYNGVGGHVEDWENGTYEAMIREFKEEAGVDVLDWRLFCRIEDHIYKGACDFFVVYSNEVLSQVCTKTDEIIYTMDLETLPWEQCLYDVRWLIPLALDRVLLNSKSITTISR